MTVPENADITDEQASAALSALDALETDAGKVASLSAELEKAQKAAVDLTKYVPVESYNALRDELAQATAQSATASLSAVLDKAEQEGRIFKSERTYLEQLGGQIGVAALSAQLEKNSPSLRYLPCRPPQRKSRRRKNRRWRCCLLMNRQQ